MRRNGGGNSRLLHPLVRGLDRRTGGADQGRVAVLIGSATYSSAVLNAIELRRAVGARLVGLPTGGNPNGAGEVRSVVLPFSGWTFQYSTKSFSKVEPGVTTLAPDLLVQPRASEWFAGRDETLAAALESPDVP